MREKKNIPLTRQEVEKKAKRQMLLVIIIGFVLLIADFAASSSQGSIKVIESNGQLYLIRPPVSGEPGHLSLKAVVLGTNETVEQKIDVTLEPYGAEADSKDNQPETESQAVMAEQQRIEYEIRKISSELNNDIESKQVKLPTVLETGEKISWEIQDETNSNIFMITLLTMILLFCVYKNRFASLEKQRKKNSESVIRQLPEFVNRLVLLLNAGLVLTSAFEKAIEESFHFNDNKNDYFYGKLKEIYVSCKSANGSIHHEFSLMAKESGIRELMRVSNIINDNVKKGTELTDKLQAESEFLWLSRKKNCEEKGRLAETKLTLPLMMFLMVLIIITVAPALMEL